MLKGGVLVDDVKGGILENAKFFNIFLQHCPHQDAGVVKKVKDHLEVLMKETSEVTRHVSGKSRAVCLCPRVTLTEIE